MEIYKHIKYNPQMRFIEGVIEEAQKDSDEWKFEHSQPITEYEWIAIFSRWVQEDPKALKLPNTKNLTLSLNKENDMVNKITVPICIDCHKPHFGRSKVEDRCICDTVGRWEYGEIDEELSIKENEIEEIPLFNGTMDKLNKLSVIKENKTMTKPKYKIGEVVFVKSELDDEKICQGVIKSAETTIDGGTWFYEIYIPLMPSDTKGETIYSYEEDTGDAKKSFIN